MATSAPPSYASPQTGGAVRRSQLLSDAIRQMQDGRTTDSYRTNTATIANTLADAVLGYAHNNADAATDRAIAADKVRVSDLIRDQFPGQANPEQQRALETQQLGANAAFDLTPQANETRAQQTATPSLASLLFETTGDPSAAITAGLGQQRQAIEDARYDQERKDKLRTPVMVAKGATAIADPDGDGVYAEIFDNPDPTAVAPGQTVQSTLIRDDRVPVTIMRDGSSKPLDFKVVDNFTMADVGGVPTPISTRSGTPGAGIATPQQVGTNKAAVADITDRGKASTQAAIDLPTSIANAQNSLDVIQGLLDHPKASSRYGMRGVLPPIPGEEAAAQAYIDQIGGAAFLQAYESLKGGGNIANTEGAKATQAITRLTTQGQDWPSAQKAARELQTIIQNGLLRARVKAGQVDLSTLSDAQLDILEGK